MAKQIGSLGVTVSANTIGLQRGFASASAEIKQFSGAARIAGMVAGQFDSALIRLGSDAASTAAQMKNLGGGISATLAGSVGILAAIALNFTKIKEAAISAAEAYADFITKTSHGRDRFGFISDTGPTMSSKVSQQMREQMLEARFNSGSIGREEFLRTKNRMSGMNEFESQQLATATIANEKAQAEKKITEDQSAAHLNLFQEEADAQDNMRRRNMMAAKEAQDEFIKWEHEKQKEAQETAKAQRQAVEEFFVGAGLANGSQFETDPIKKAIMGFQERIDALKNSGDKIGADFGISSQAFHGAAPVGQVIGPQREQAETNKHLDEIKAIEKEGWDWIRANGLGVSIK